MQEINHPTGPRGGDEYACPPGPGHSVLGGTGSAAGQKAGWEWWTGAYSNIFKNQGKRLQM